MARLAADGMAFPRAYAANPAGGPSRAALHTGRYPHAVAVPWDGRALAAEYACLADGFAKAGYETGIVGKWDLDDVRDVRRGYAYWADGGTADQRAALAVTYLRKQRTAPFFLFAALGKMNGDQADGLVGRVVAEAGPETLVVVTADRGLGTRGTPGSFLEESVGVPLVMRWTGRLAAGTEQDWLFNNVDLAPTLRGLCGIAAMEGAQGEDRAALILGGGSGERPESVYLQGELGTPREWRVVIRGWDKLVVDRALKVTHLYNLAQDPLETDNLAVDRASIRRQEELLALMRRWIIKTADRVPYPGAAREK